MKAESEVAISFAISIFSNEKFTPDDYRLTYKSYEELGLICENCRELVFFKQGIERVSHFSHFRDTGKDCPWRTESHSNTQSSDSYKREQSLQEFQTKFRGIVERAIIRYRQILSTQLYTQIAEGKSLVSTYKIDIESWVRWFNLNRKQLENLANNLYQSNELVSERNQRILLNFLDYLCVPASEYILIDILYYVFGLLDKEISLKKYLEEVPSKVIELMSYADWEKEYQVAQESLTFNEFPGYTHPNLPAKPPKSATITERIEPKPIKLDGARTNDHEYQLRAIIGNVPCLLTFKKSFHLWDVIALPVKVSPYHLAVYLSDKVGSTELLNHIKTQLSDLNLNLARNEVKIEEVTKQLTNLPDNDYFLPGSRRLKVELESLVKVSDGINDIIHSLDGLSLDIKDRKFPRPMDVLESTKIIEKCLREEYIKPESSYTDDYYRWHNLGTLRIIEQVEREKPTYTLTILGDEKDTRRSSIPLVMNWLRRVPKILQDHFKEDYPTNEEIKSHLMSIYPFYKRKVREGDKIDKSFINLEADMIIKTKGRLIMEIYFNGQLQTSQLLSITKPVNNPERQGKIPVKISSSVEIKSVDTLTHLLRCDEVKQTFSAQNTINRLVQKFVDSNIKLFTREKEEKIVSRVAIKDLLGFSKESKGYPQIAKQFNKFTLPYTSESEVNLGKLINLLTLETFDCHDIANLLDKMVNNWKHWNKSETINLAGFSFTKKDPGELMVNIFHTIKHNQDRSQVVWGEFIDQLYLLSKLPIGFRTSEGVLLTPGSLLPTDRKTWEHRIRIQLISIIKEGDKTRTLGIESLLQRDIYSLYSLLNRLQPGWNNNEDINKHLQALHDTLAAEGDTEAIPEIPDTVEETQNHLESRSEVLEVNPEITQPIETTEEVSQVTEDKAEPAEPLNVSTESSLPLLDTISTLEDNSEVSQELSVNPRMSICVALENTEKKMIKKQLPLEVKELLPMLDAWLLATQQKAEFIEALKTNDHNSIVLYLYPSYTWEVQMIKKERKETFEEELIRVSKDICKLQKVDHLSDLCFSELKKVSAPNDFQHYSNIRSSIVNSKGYHKSIKTSFDIVPQLRHKLESSERIQQITSRTKGAIQRNGKEPIPLLGNLFYISHVRVKDTKGNTFLVQSYLEKINGKFTQVSRKVAIFEGGTLQYFKDLNPIDASQKDIKPLVVADGDTMFPDLSIAKIRLEYLEPDASNAGCLVSCYRDYLKKDHGTPVVKAPIAAKLTDRKEKITLNRVFPTLCYLASKLIKDPTSKAFELYLLIYLDAVTIPELDYLEKDVNGDLVTVKDLFSAPKTFIGFTHPNLAPKTVRQQIKPEAQQPKPIALDAAKVISGKLVTKGVIVNTPMILVMENSGDNWTISGLPVKVPDYDLAIYLSDKLGLKDLLTHIDQTLSGLSLDNQEGKLIRQLKDDLMTGYKVSKHQILASTQIIQTCLDNAELREKTMYMDNYYCPHTLGWIEFNEDLEKDHLTYTMTVWGNERDTRRSEVPTVINWLKRVPINLKSEFKSEYPTFKQIEKYLHSKFTFSSCKLALLEEYQGNRGIFVEIYYQGKLQTRQMIAITNPVTDTRNKGKLPVKFNHRFEPMPVKTFFEVMKLTPVQKHLVNDAKAYLNRVVDRFVAANRLRFVGVDKIATVASTKEIVGFDKTAKSFNQVAGTFKKWILPFTEMSQVEQGKLIDLTTLETYNETHVTQLLESIIRGWKYWEYREQEKIELGGNMVHKSDPGRLMMNVHHLVSDNPKISELVWKDVINTFYQISGLLIGFRCTNGVLLTPFDIYSNDVERWEHRIKIQLISILKDGDKTRTLGIESLLQREIEDLYSILDRLSPNWNTNQDINKHLAELHDCLSTAKKLNP
ncbi:hypothetical protein NDA07_05475 [Microcoleus vaginatus DQ-U2]|uniref:hypothetical protein n=1 Tax=Microcoleus vaginatus TaxID=119532 RepID=UPI001687EAAB|nr:hypothetical protein [Microcoleus sp. FACHB-DQ6]